MKNVNVAVACGAGLGGVLAGAVCGYFLARRRFDEQIDAEVEALKAHYREREAARAEARAQTRPRWTDVVRTTVEGQQAGEVVSLEGSDTGEGVRVIFPTKPDLAEISLGPREPVVLATEHIIRDRTVPYHITEEEFAEEHNHDYQKLSITFYEGDGTLVDDKDQPVPDINGTVGPDLAEAFGYGSNDPDVAYIRNERLEVDFEVSRDMRTFAELLGYGNPKLAQAKKRKEG